MNTAQIILLLISPDYLASAYCYSVEMKRALERHEAKEARVIPILLQPIDWQETPFYKLQMLPTGAKPVTRWRHRADAFFNIATGIRQVVNELLSNASSAVESDLSVPSTSLLSPTLPSSCLEVRSDLSHLLARPKGSHLPARYGAFVGREQDVARVLEGLRSSCPLISIEGLSGLGKTTLAIEIAHHFITDHQTHFEPPFQKIVWISAKDRLKQKHWLLAVLDAVADQLNYPSLIQLPPKQKSEQVRQLLHMCQTLLIVDNFETIADPDLETWIQDVPMPSKALITTSHSHLHGPYIWSVRLKGLEDVKALELIEYHAQRLHLQPVRSPKEASGDLLHALVHASDGNPKVTLQLHMSQRMVAPARIGNGAIER